MKYPLSVYCWFTNESDVKFMSKGHHDFSRFLGHCAAEDEWSFRLVKYVAHQWWRVIPDGTGEHYCVYIPAVAGSRGAFPVTIATDDITEGGIHIDELFSVLS